MNVKCAKCGHIGDESTFPKGRDFFQHPFISSCPMKCGNRVAPGDASMRMFGGTRPFEYVRDDVAADATALEKTIHRSREAS